MSMELNQECSIIQLLKNCTIEQKASKSFHAIINSHFLSGHHLKEEKVVRHHRIEALKFFLKQRRMHPVKMSFKMGTSLLKQQIILSLFKRIVDLIKH